MSLYIFSNLSAPISLPLISAQGLSTIARLFTNDSSIRLNFDFSPLPSNPVVAQTAIPIPPLVVLTFSSFLSLAYFNFAYGELGRLANKRDLGIWR